MLILSEISNRKHSRNRKVPCIAISIPEWQKNIRQRLWILAALIAVVMLPISAAGEAVKIIADFNAGSQLNNQGGTDWTFMSTGGNISPTYSGQHLHLTYDVSGTQTYSGYVMPFVQPVDATDFNALVLAIRGAHGAEHVKVGLGDSSDREQKVLISQFLPGGITTDWQIAVIPLKAFTTISSATFNRVVVAFENQLGAESGAVDIDEIKFANTGTLLAIPVENFDDGASEDGEGGQFWTITGGDGTISSNRSADSPSGTGKAYQVSASVVFGTWATLAFDLRGLDVRDEDSVSFFIKGTAGGERPHIYLVSGIPGNEVRRYVELRAYARVTTDWQRVSIPLQDFSIQGVDVAQLIRCEVVWEWATLNETILLDDISFRQIRNSPPPIRPSAGGWDFAASGAIIQVSTSATALQITYDVTPAGSFSGHVIPFSHEIDTTGYDVVALEVRGGHGGEHIKLGLGDGANQEQKVLLSQFLPGGITTTWRTLLVPLRVFTTVNRQTVTRIVIAFENQLGAESGTVEINNLRIIKSGALLPTPVETFDDGTIEDAEGGQFWTVTGGGGSISSVRVNESATGIGHSYRVTASVEPGSWATLAFDLRGLNVTDEGFFVFLIKGAAGGERPHIYLVSGVPGNEVRQWVDIQSYTTVTTEWQRVSIPLHDFAVQGVELSRLMRCEVVWEWASLSQTITLDDISFVPAAHGSWRTLMETTPINPVHMALMNNGKVLVVSGSGNMPTNEDYAAAVWNPADGSIITEHITWDMFCNGMAILPDGRPFVVGGTKQYDPFFGSIKSSAYDPVTATFSDLQDMSHGRWYPTITTLGDGSMMAFSGLSEMGDTNLAVEIFTPASGWSQEYTAPWTPPLYPRMHLLPNGKVFYSGSSTESHIFDPASHGWNMNVAETNYKGWRTYGTSVLLPLTQANNYKPMVMIMGGGNPATPTTEIIDLSMAAPQWLLGPPMSQARIEMNATILPTGKILATGGSANDEDGSTASFNADLYDPGTNTFITGAPNIYPRLYHSNALLLPDATVLVAGGNPSRGSYEQHNEIYLPPYLFNADGSPAPRPVISGVTSGAISYGSAFQVQTPNAAGIRSVVLVKPGAATHAFDMDQRLVELSFTAGQGTLDVTAPSNGNIAPPGHYMLFVVNSSGVPSTAEFIRLSAAN